MKIEVAFLSKMAEIEIRTFLCPVFLMHKHCDIVLLWQCASLPDIFVLQTNDVMAWYHVVFSRADKWDFIACYAKELTVFIVKFSNFKIVFFLKQSRRNLTLMCDYQTKWNPILLA